MLEPLKKQNLAKYTTFKIGGDADLFYVPDSLDEFVDILRNNKDIVVLGAGSNSIISSFGVSKPVVLTKKLDDINIQGDVVTVDCGVKTALLAQKVAEYNLSGMEFLACIPASLGGVVAMNASAHGQVIADIILSAKVFNLKTNQIEELSKNELQLDYRSSIIEGDYVVLSAKFKLKEDLQENIITKMQVNKAYREEKQPSMKTPNAGSTFKNPQGAIAGKLIDDAGLKGFSVGGACVSSVHANFLTNNSNATSFDILSLMFEIKAKIQEKYGYNLIPEVKYIGDKSEKEQEIWTKLNS